MKKNRIIIAGSRNCPEDDFDLLSKIHHLTSNMNGVDMEIVSGTCRGADKLGEFYAYQSCIPVKQFPADWDKYGVRAGHLRNEEMAKYSTHLIAIVDLSVPSRGTRNMIKLAKKYGLLIRIIYINCENDNYGRL